MAWMRACAARTSWIGGYARAAGWISDFPSCDIAMWDASPFAQALAAGLGGSPVQQRPAAAQRVRRVVPPLPNHTAGTTAKAAVASRADRLAAGRPAVGMVGGRTRTRAPYDLLARAAGLARVAIQPAAVPRRIHKEPDRPAERRIPAAAPAAVAAASLGRRLAGRMAARIGPKPGGADVDLVAIGTNKPAPGSADNGLRGRAASSPLAAPPGWTHRIAAPIAGLLVRERADAAAWPAPVRSAPMGAAAQVSRRMGWARTTEAGGGSPRRVPGPIDTVTGSVAGPVRHEPVSVLAQHGSAAVPGLAGVSNEQTGGFEASRPIAADRAWRDSRATGESGFAAGRVAGSALDPVAFAEQLRAVLLDDARRHGIEV